MLICLKNKLILLRDFFSCVLYGKEFAPDGGDDVLNSWQYTHNVILFSLCYNPDAERFHPNLKGNVKLFKMN